MFRASILRGCGVKGTAPRGNMLSGSQNKLENILCFYATWHGGLIPVFLLQYPDLNTQTPSTPLLAWDAPLMAPHERTPSWYRNAAIVAVAFMAFGILTGNWTFTVAIGLAAGWYFLHRNVQPQDHHIALSSIGFTLDESYTSWAECTGFSLRRLRTHTELTVMRKRGAALKILTGSIDPMRLRDTLSPLLPERSDVQERWIDALVRTLKL